MGVLYILYILLNVLLNKYLFGTFLLFHGRNFGEASNDNE